MIEVVLDSVRRHEASGKHLLLLWEKAGPRVVPIWVGEWDADAASRALNSLPVPRPQPHDLMVEAIDRLGGRVVQAAITGITDRAHDARLVLQQGEQRLELEARPCDAVNLAVRAGAPIFAADELLELRPEARRRPTEAERREEAGNA